MLYSVADGSVGTPQQIKDRVAATGLEVEWTNAGPSGGDGDTDCGIKRVTVTESDGQLRVTVGDERQLLTPEVVGEISSCR